MSSRTVELDLVDAETILRSLFYAEKIPAVGPAVGRLRDAVVDARSPGSGLEELLALVAEPITRERARRNRRRHWPSIRQAVGILEDALPVEDPAVTARIDELGAYVRNVYEAHGLRIDDEETLFVTLTTAGLIVEMARNSRDNGTTSGDGFQAIARVVQSFSLAVAPHVPEAER